MRRLEYMKQPNGAILTIDIQQLDGYTEDDLVRLNERHRFYSRIHVDYGWNSYRSNYQKEKTLYGDKEGLYTYKAQKKPFYKWKVDNIEDEYENWSKSTKGYSIPLNEPRKISVIELFKMKATELITELQKLVDKYGDCIVFDTIRDETEELSVETINGKTLFFIN